MLRRRSADRPSSGPHTSAYRRQIAAQSERTCSSEGLISRLRWEPRPDFKRAIDPPQTKAPGRSCWPDRPRSLSPSERVNIDRQRLDRGGVEAAHPGRHHAGTAVADGLDQRGLVGSIKPDLVREIRRTELPISLAGIAVACRAIIRENLGARGRIISRAGGQARQRSNVIGDRDDLLLFQDALLAERKHGAFVGLGVSRARTELDRLQDLV